jgi:two-component system sensor histidine kinase/response regulator
MDLEVTDFNLRNCLEEALRPLALRADEKRIELLCDITASVPAVVRGDPTRLRQVVVNLIGNAIKFTSKGEVALRVDLEAGENKSQNLCFTVADTGIGIAADKQGAIFNPFSQADTSTTRKYGGTGLGLSICVRLVSMMGGRVWFESEEGRGSQFHFTARLEPVVNTAKPEAIALCEKLHSTSVLIVDDNATNRRILMEMLQRPEIRTSAVASSEDALAELVSANASGRPYQLILTDRHMPNMDGFGLIEKIRSIPELSTTAIMMLTSAGHREDVERCKELGIISSLLKPVRQSDLLSVIGRALGENWSGAQPDKPVQPVPMLRDKNLRILVAEDNCVNQTVAVRTLEKMGHSVVVAENGLQALSLLTQEAFDLVLMDIQMPQMDGLAATREIREAKLPGYSQIPIVAMTALAMKGDKERCLKGGMDGYVSKPLDRRELEEAIASAVNSPGDTPMTSAETNSHLRPESSSTFDFNHALDRLDGDKALLSEIVQIFLDETPKNLEVLRLAILQKDSKTIERITHSLKGELGYLGVPGVSQRARDLEEMSRINDLQCAPESFVALEAEISAVMDSMRSTNGIPLEK